ncbi:MAG: OmpL47-type beta-barrel domain-containing protein [Cytophagales bacterium]
MKKFSLASMVFLATIFQTVFAQTQPTYTKKYYVAENGKLYWNKDLPFFLFGSSDSTGSQVQLLRSENAAKYTNPMYFDTEGVNYLRSRWAVNAKTKKKIDPELEIAFAIYRDGTAPSTGVKFYGANKFLKENILFYGKYLKADIYSKDAMSGVESIYYAINGAEYANFESTIDLGSEDSYELKAFAVDNTGNVAEPRTYLFQVDTTAPVSKIGVYNDYINDILSIRTSVKVSSTDNEKAGVAGRYYKIDGKGAKIYLESLKFAELKEGDHTLTYFAKDNVGNIEHGNDYSFFLDKTAPKVTTNIVGEQYQNRGRVYVSDRTKIELIAEDNKAGVEEVTYSIDGGAVRTYSEPFTLPKGTGTHIIEYHAKDKVNNNSYGKIDQAILNKRSLDMDMVPPALSNLFSGNKYKTRDTLFITKNTKIVLGASDVTSGVKEIGYKINGEGGNVYTKPFTIDEDGFYEVDYFGTDQVNNRNTSKFYIEVDNTPPRITYILSSDPIGSISLKNYDEPLSVYPKSINLYLGAADNRIDVAKIYYSINGSSEAEYLKPISLERPGVVKIKIRALDNLGNESKESYTLYLNNN